MQQDLLYNLPKMHSKALLKFADQTSKLHKQTQQTPLCDCILIHIMHSIFYSLLSNRSPLGSLLSSYLASTLEKILFSLTSIHELETLQLLIFFTWKQVDKFWTIPQWDLATSPIYITLLCSEHTILLWAFLLFHSYLTSNALITSSYSSQTSSPCVYNS